MLFKIILCTESLNSYEMKFAKSLKLNNGNILIAGNVGIYTYDNTGKNLLYECPITENNIELESDAFYTTLVQFPKKYNGLVLAFVKHIMYILDSNGNFKFKKQPPNLSLSENNKFYTIVPHTYNNNNYFFVLAYINEGSKAILQYFSINIENEAITLNADYVFDENDSDRVGLMYTKYFLFFTLKLYLKKNIGK